MFRTKYKLDNSKFVSKSGTGKLPVYYVHFDKNGKRLVDKKTDEKGEYIYDDVYAKIQASAESTNINTIIQKFVQTGNQDLLIQNRGAFLDLTSMPTSQFDMLNKLASAKYTFEKLPIEIKQNFNNDVNTFIAMAGQPNFFKLLGYKDVNKDGKIDKTDVKETTSLKEKEKKKDE